MNDLERYFRENNDRLINKWMHYFDVYDRHFSKFRNKPINILEIGVSQGGSLQMWKDYFGDKATIYGIDVVEECKRFEEEHVKIFIGSQADRKFLREVMKKVPPLDILIDDGGHTMRQQIISFEELFGHVKSDGVYLCEDLHTSYWLRYGGGYKRNGTFIEYSKNFIDQLNAWHSRQRRLKVNEFTKSVQSVHYYDSIVVVEKGERQPPHFERTGNVVYEASPTKRSIGKHLRIGILRLTNRVLHFFGLASPATDCL